MATSDGRTVLTPKQLIIPTDVNSKVRFISGMMFISGEAVFFYISGAAHQIPMS